MSTNADLRCPERDIQNRSHGDRNFESNVSGDLSNGSNKPSGVHTRNNDSKSQDPRADSSDSGRQLAAIIPDGVVVGRSISFAEVEVLEDYYDAEGAGPVAHDAEE